MEKKLKQLYELLGEVVDLEHLMELAEWDQETYMPKGAAQARSQQLATMARTIHARATSEAIGELLDALKPWSESNDPDSDVARLIKVTAKDYDREKRIPADFVAERAQVTALAKHAWLAARKQIDFSIFRPHLEKIIDLNRRYVTFFPTAEHPYDVLLDQFEPGMKTSQVQSIFQALQPRQVELINAIGKQRQIDAAFLHLDYDEQAQWDFGMQVISALGFDLEHGRQDRSAHPFSTSFSRDDVRITTRFEKHLGASGLFSTIHEAGHGLYEQGIGTGLARTPLARGASFAVHESQSRLWENIVGRSHPFWEYFFPKLQQHFPSQLGPVTLDQFYRGINRVAPSLTRVEADEATYNLHVMLRFELEIAMIEGNLAVKELPDVWNARMQAYLGVVPPNDLQGVLQDIHWAMGTLGYFATYALGNLISVQLWEAFRAAHPDIDTQIRQGDFSTLLAWLRQEIHQYGRKYEPGELVQRATASEIDPAPYLRYLRTKYEQIYGL